MAMQATRRRFFFNTLAMAVSVPLAAVALPPSSAPRPTAPTTPGHTWNGVHTHPIRGDCYAHNHNVMDPGHSHTVYMGDPPHSVIHFT